MLQPPIPLMRPEKKELQKGQYLTFKLRNDPANADSTTYDLSVCFFETGTPEELIDFVIDTELISTGQNITKQLSAMLAWLGDIFYLMKSLSG